MAYYLFVNHGWPPSRLLALPFRERVLLAAMMKKEVQGREGE